MSDATTNWVERYRKAWETNDPDGIRRLFTEDAEYHTDPWATPWRGHDEIVAQWLENQDDPGSTTFEWSPVVITDDVSVVQGVTKYAGAATYSNLWVIRLSQDGRANSFTEWWMDQAKPS